MNLPRAGLLFCIAMTTCHAWGAIDPALGKWATTDRDTEPGAEVTMVMELHVVGDSMQGRVVRLVRKGSGEFHPTCERCSGDLHRQPVVGATFIRALKKRGEKWVGGRVIDLRPGATQGFEAWCELEVVGGRLRFLGYKWRWARGVPLLSREVYWDRIAEP